MNFSSSAGINSLSSSIAVNVFAFFANSSVSMPSPGPISMTVSFDVIFAVCTMRWTIFFDWRKFWPSDFLALCVELILRF